MKWNSEFLNKLCDPVSGEDLIIEESNLLKPNETKTSYPIKNRVAILLVKEPDSKADFDYAEHYERDAEVFDYANEYNDPVENSEIRRLRQRILSQVSPEDEWVLDVGCGGGWLAESLITKNKKVISMDISFTNPKKAIENTPSENHFAVVADVFNLPFKKNSFDCIVASEIIEHVINPQIFITNLINVLKPGGKLIITTPYNEKIKYSLCIHCNKLTPHNAHLHSFTEQSIKKLISVKTAYIHTTVFNSKLLTQLRMTFLFRFLPGRAWNFIDQFFIIITRKKAYRLMLEIIK